MPLTPLDDIYRERRFPWPAAVLGVLVLAVVLWFVLRPGRGKEDGEAAGSATNAVAGAAAAAAVTHVMISVTKEKNAK